MSDGSAYIDQVRAAWVANPDGPSLRTLFSDDDLALLRMDHEALEEALLADQEEADARGVARPIEDYRAIIPDVSTHRGVWSALVVYAMGRQKPGDVGPLAARLATALPELGGDIARAEAVCKLMAGQAPSDDAFDPRPGDRVGKYTLVDALGAGSFGRVWLARDEELRRYVALKLLLVADAAGLARAIAEARAAAAIDHPNIVKVHAAGQLPGWGLPFIDSQLAGDPAPKPADAAWVQPGVSLEAHVRSASNGRLSPEEAARTLMTSCHAVAAAHARGVVHRDIKPSNIIITPSGRAMVADFGLSILQSVVAPGPTGTFADAKGATAGTHSAPGSARSSGRITGTPAYMSPEQARGEQATPASDIFSLGATLRFALTGSPPLSPSGRFSNDGRWDVIEQVKRLGTHPPPPLPSDVPRTLAAICERAMAPEPASRYVSAEQMAVDISAWLEHRPTIADPPGTTSAFLLWYRRNLASALVGTAAALGLAAGVTAYVVSVGRERDRALAAEQTARAAELVAEQRRREAEVSRQREADERQTAQLVAGFMSDVLASPDPDVSGRDVKVREVLDIATGKLEDLKDRPAVRAAAERDLARSYLALGVADKGLALATEAHTHFAQTLGPQHASTLDAAEVRIRGLIGLGRTADAEALARTALDAYRLTVGEAHVRTLTAAHNLAEALRLTRKTNEALELAQHTLDGRIALLGPDAEETLATKSILALIASDAGDAPKAGQLLQEIADSCRRAFKPSHTMRLQSLNNLAMFQRSRGKVAQAETNYREAWGLAKSALGDDHPYTLNLESNLGVLLKEDNRLDDAEPLFRRVLAARARLLGENHRDTILSMSNLASLLHSRKDHAQAEALHRKTLEARRAHYPEDGRGILTSMVNLAAVLRDLERLDEADAMFVEADAVAQTAAPPNSPARLSLLRQHGLCLMKMKQFDRSLERLQAAFDACAAALGPNHPRTKDSARSLAELFDAWGKPDEASAWRAKADGP